MYSEHKTFKLAKGLVLEERTDSAVLKARAHINGRSHFFNTETTDYDRAERKARSWFARLKSDHTPGQRTNVTMHEAAKAFIADIRKPVRKKYHQTKWDAISPFFQAVDVDAVDTPLLKKFLRSRTHVKPITQAKDLVTLRLLLRHAVEEGWLTALPVFPRVGKLDANPRPWFTSEQWEMLLEVAQERIEEAEQSVKDGMLRGNAEATPDRRMNILEFIRLQEATCMRVDELRSVRVRDVTIRTSKRQTIGGHSLPPEVAQLLKGKNVKMDSNEYLEIDLHEGVTEGTTEGLKRGPRIVVTRVANSGVETFRAVVNRKGLKPSDLLFEGDNSDAFRELLIAARLRTVDGMHRNLKAVRCTGIMRWVLAEPNANLKLLASNFGTSILMLDLYYLRPLNVQMRREELAG